MSYFQSYIQPYYRIMRTITFPFCFYNHLYPVHRLLGRMDPTCMLRVEADIEHT
jgi:hypothetical protein